MGLPPLTTGSRRLLARLRDVMAGPGTPQERLDRIVRLIASDMVSEVCSVYVLRAGEVLELYATTGLRSTAIHQTRLGVGEGLVGYIASQARSLAASDAQEHPNFVFRPETGEEDYQSLLGVPILRGGRVHGVLVVQNRTHRRYTEDETETLETVAMVVAELVAGGRLIGRDERQALDGDSLLPITIHGVRLNGGLAMGEAVRHEPHLTIQRLVADDVEVELSRLEEAVAEMHGALDAMLADRKMAGEGEHRDILETYRMIAEDAGWLSRISDAIGGGLTAEAAVERVHSDTRARFRNQSDPYLRERLHDFDDLANRLLQHLLGSNGNGSMEDLPDNIILFARTMGPAELLDYDRRKLKGLVLEDGSATTHVAIVARALDIPVVGHAKDVLEKVEPFDSVIIDADNAQVLIRPEDDVHEAFSDTLKTRVQRMAAYASLKDVTAETKDGIEISLNINAGLISDVDNLEETGADGIGLYRTEIPFLNLTEMPDVNKQAEIYAKIIDQADGKPVIFRTLDVGGDKNLPYWSDAGDENPAMGWRAIRVTLDRPVLLRHQLRALIRASEGRPLSIMFPMITEVAEFDAARALLDRELNIAKERGRVIPENLRVGTMLEVPALAYQMPALLKRVDFLSIGSNDLFQFLFASDRGSPRIGDRYDALSPAGLSFLGQLVTQADAAGIPVGLCGEMAGRPLDAMALIGIGFRNLSMTPSSIGPVKTMIRSLSKGSLERYLDSLKDVAEHSLREQLRGFARDHGVEI